VAAGAGYGIDRALTTNATNTSPYEQAISYTKTRAPFRPARPINVRSASQLRSALASLRPGDLVRATADFTVSSSSAEALDIKNRLRAPAVIDLTGQLVRFVYSGDKVYSAVLLDNPENL